MTIFNDFVHGVADLGEGVSGAVVQPLPGVVKAVQTGVDTLDHLGPGGTVHGHLEPVAGHAHSGVDFDFGTGHADLSGLAEHTGSLVAHLPQPEAFTLGATASDDGGDGGDPPDGDGPADLWPTHQFDDLYRDAVHSLAAHHQPGHEIPGIGA